MRRPVSVKNLPGVVSDLTARLPRPAVPTFVTGRRAAVVGSTLVVASGAVVAFLNRPRPERGRVAVKAVVDGPEGYIVVITETLTFLAPASLSPYFEYYEEKGGLAGYVLGHEKIDGVRVGSAA